jgi:hypothetical protein
MFTPTRHSSIVGNETIPKRDSIDSQEVLWEISYR